MFGKWVVGFVASALITIESREITEDALNRMRDNFLSDPRYRMAQNAATRNSIQDVAIDWNRFSTISHVFSHKLPLELQATSQERSGRCWIFTVLNAMRPSVAKEYNLANFEFSQSYLFFWDKLEKANYFLECVIESANQPTDSFDIIWLFHPMSLCQDGGTWHMAVNLIRKYGVVPQSVFPDSSVCMDSWRLNQILQMKLSEDGITLRKLIAEGVDNETVFSEKERMIEEIYRILSIHIGTPPQEFDWEFADSEGKAHLYRELTPKSFYKEYVKADVEDYVQVVHSPRKKTPYYNMYTVKYIENVTEGEPYRAVNLPIDEMKGAVLRSLLDNKAVWCGCDVSKFSYTNLGVMDTKLYDFELLYGIPFHTTKEERLEYRQTQAAHAMLFTGVNLVDDLPTKWRVENSWGTNVGHYGYFLMTDEWFDEYMIDAAVHKKYLSPKALEALDLPPIQLEPWDPLYSCKQREK